MPNMRRVFLPFLAASLFAVPAQAQATAQTGPMPSAWQQVAAGQWADATRQCTYRTEQRGQAFPNLTVRESATAMASRVRTELVQQGMRGVQVRPVQRGQHWALFAEYTYPSTQGDVQVSQLYVSNGGLLRNVTASTYAQTVSVLPINVQAASTSRTPAPCWPTLTHWVEFIAR